VAPLIHGSEGLGEITIAGSALPFAVRSVTGRSMCVAPSVGRAIGRVVDACKAVSRSEARSQIWEMLTIVSGHIHVVRSQGRDVERCIHRTGWYETVILLTMTWERHCLWLDRLLKSRHVDCAMHVEVGAVAGMKYRIEPGIIRRVKQIMVELLCHLHLRTCRK
jgi:hypothetical protein